MLGTILRTWKLTSKRDNVPVCRRLHLSSGKSDPDPTHKHLSLHQTLGQRGLWNVVRESLSEAAAELKNQKEATTSGRRMLQPNEQEGKQQQTWEKKSRGQIMLGLFKSQ